MKIAVVCTNGKAGKFIVKEAVERGLDEMCIRDRDREVEKLIALIVLLPYKFLQKWMIIDYIFLL